MAMNIVQLQDNLKNLSDQQLAQSMQMPSQDTPPFLVVSELNRRKKMREDFQAQQASQNQTTVAQDVVAAAGVPQQAASAMAQSLAPKTDMTNNTGIMSIPQGGEPQRMAGGGVVKMFEGQAVSRSGMPITGGGYDPLSSPGSIGDIFFSGISDIGGTLLGRTVEEQKQIDAQRAAAIAAGVDAKGPPKTNLTYSIPDGLGRIAPATKVTEDTQKKTTAGGGAASKPSTYEQMLIDAAANADKKAKQDKWMALAQMGLSMMSSQSPTLLGAVGEAGAASLPMYQQARDTADTTKMEAAKGLYALQAQRAAAAAAAAQANAPARPKPIDVGALSAFDPRIKALSEQLAMMPDGDAKMQVADQLDQLLANAQITFQAYMAQRGVDLSGGITNVPTDTGDPEDFIDATP